MIPVMQFAFAGLNVGTSGAGGGYTGLTWIGSDEEGGFDEAPYNFTSVNFTASGTSTNNKVIVAVGLDRGTITGVTVQGGAASLVAELTQGSGDTRVHVAIYISSFSPGGDNSIVIETDVVSGNNDESVGFGVWTVNMTSPTAYDTASGTDTDTNITSTIDLPANGFCVGLSTRLTGGTHTINASFTERAELSSTDMSLAFSDRATVPEVINESVTDTWSASGQRIMSVFASFAG